MSLIHIILIVIGSLTIIVFVTVSIAVSRRVRRLEREAWERFQAQHSFAFDYADGTDQRLRGYFDGIPLEIRHAERLGGSGRGNRLVTRFRVEGAMPWPARLIVYTPGFSKATGGKRGRILDNRGDHVAIYAAVNDFEIGDPDLDAHLAIDTDDVRLAGAILKEKNLKAWLFSTISRCGHVRIKDREVAIEAKGRLKTFDDLVDHARHAVGVARALHAACFGPPGGAAHE